MQTWWIVVDGEKWREKSTTFTFLLQWQALLISVYMQNISQSSFIKETKQAQIFCHAWRKTLLKVSLHRGGHYLTSLHLDMNCFPFQTKQSFFFLNFFYFGVLTWSYIYILHAYIFMHKSSHIKHFTSIEFNIIHIYLT